MQKHLYRLSGWKHLCDVCGNTVSDQGLSFKSLDMQMLEAGMARLLLWIVQVHFLYLGYTTSAFTCLGAAE